MSGQDGVVHRVEHGILQAGKAGLEIFGIGDVRSPCTNLSDSGRIGGASQGEAGITFIYVYKRNVEQGGIFVAGHDGMQGGGHVLALAGGGDNQGSGREDFLSVGIFLGHGHGVLARGDVDAYGDGEVAGTLDSAVEAGILALVAAGPHPVGAEGDAVDIVADGGPDDVGQGLGYGQAGTCGRVDHGGGGSMSDGHGYALGVIVADGGDS